MVPDVWRCQAVVESGVYRSAISYALGRLHAAGPNLHQYLDASHHAGIGWDTTFASSAELLAETVREADGGLAAVDGFLVNAAGYQALTEPYFTATQTVAGSSVRWSKWVDWNTYIDESTFATAWRAELVRAGFPSTVGILIDTSRNGWGGSARPTGTSVSWDVNTFVNQSRVDRRASAVNWCNQRGAGLGERPRVAPAPGVDAYIWAKPPGESDGTHLTVPVGPDNPAGKPAAQMCDPDYWDNSRASSVETGALRGAPAFGRWFPAQFRELMANAHPPLPAVDAPVPTST